jgi:hypothetical protein
VQNLRGDRDAPGAGWAVVRVIFRVNQHIFQLDMSFSMLRLVFGSPIALDKGERTVMLIAPVAFLKGRAAKRGSNQ